MRRMSAVGSFVKNIADRLRALLTITQVLTRSTGEGNNSSRSSNNIQPPVEDPVAALAAGGFSAGTIARRTVSPGHVSSSRADMESARTPEDERHFKRNVLLAFASAVIGLTFGVPFTLLKFDSGRRKTSLTTQLLVSSCVIVMAIVLCCMVMICLLLYWGVHYLRIAGYICIISGFLVFLLEVFGIFLVMQTVYT